jgi:spore maturation protein B
MLADISLWIVPILLVGIPVYGLARGVNVYQAFVDGAAEAWPITRQLLPYMVAIFTAIGVARSTGAMAAFARALAPLVARAGIPAEVVPLAVVRPLSGNAALALVIDLMKRHGPDSLTGRMAATMNGAADTTLYIVAVYFAHVGVRNSRWALPVGLAGDLAGFVAAVWFSTVLFGPPRGGFGP